MQPLREIADCRLGKMLDAEKNRGELRPYLRNTNVQWGAIDLSDVKEMRIEDDERDRYAVQPGDLLVCEGGEPGRCAVWRDDREMYLQKALHRVRPLNGTSVEYLRWFLQGATASGALENLYTGSTIKHLPGRQLAQIMVPTPPPAEQRRIAERLETIGARRASIAGRLASSRAIVDRLRAAVLAAACSGRLTADWRNEHGALTSEAPDGPPATWEPMRLGDIVRIATGATPLRKNSAYYRDGTIPWVTSGAVNAGTISEPTEMITPLALKETNVKLFPPGTLLIAMYGEGQTRGRVAELAVEAGTNQALAAIVFDQRSAPFRPYLRLFFENSYQRMRAASLGGVQPNLSLGMFKETVMPLPPLEEQRVIVERAAAALATADRLRVAISSGEVSLSGASRAAVRRAFRGDLVQPRPSR